jgi:mannose-6-phosphate isomerase-like protein (cupin superfamily)
VSVRRVITATGHDGRSYVSRDNPVEAITVAALPGYAWHRLWGTPDGDDHFPPAGGVRFNLFTVPPESTGRPPLTPDLAEELDAKLPGRSRYMKSDQAGRHRTATVDLVVVLAGRVRLDLDDAAVELTPGDAVVQDGTRHAWRNPYDEPCTLAIVLIGR